ncbi:MAG: hydrolase [Rubritepida sp.]|nr:hydrolase [Rubritepida sp.]
MTKGDDNPGGADAGGPPPKRAVIPKDAASIILWRKGARGTEILMGRRHRDMRFMPGVLVFPGGRVDLEDRHTRSTSDLGPEAQRMLELSATPSRARALAVCALREMHEETGLVMGRIDEGSGRLCPDLAPVGYLTRAITPADRPMRFHARFLIAEAKHATGEIQGSGELEEVRFFALDELHAQPVAKITALVLEEFEAWLAMTPVQRAKRELVRIQGKDNRVVEKRRG